MSFIFISYSRQDQDYVGLLAQELEFHNLPVWLDDHIDYGTTWPRVIREQLERCQVFLIVMSPRSEESHWVQCELTHAIELRKDIFPLLLEGPRWFSVAALQAVDVTDGKLPPARFFDTLHTRFPASSATAKSTLIQEAAADAIPSAPLMWAPPTAPSKSIKPVAAPDIEGFLSGLSRKDGLSSEDHTTPSVPIEPAEAPSPSNIEGFLSGLSRKDGLNSEKGVDYRKLRDLLKAGQWKEADQETDRRMLEAVGRGEGDLMRDMELLDFPCIDLNTIDGLWMKYSNGTWGFTVQKRIYLECLEFSSELDSQDKVWHEFCRRVGWYNSSSSYVSYSNLTFDLENSPLGKLPGIVAWFVGCETDLWQFRVPLFVKRLGDCSNSFFGK